MSIIHQNYQLLLNKLFKDVINQDFNVSSFRNYIDLITNYNNEIFKCARKTLVKFFELIDNYYKNSEERKRDYYTKGKCSRYLVTIFGELTFEREYYVPINDSEENGFFYVDKCLGLKKSDIYDPIVKAMLMEAKADKSFQKAADEVSKYISIRNDREIHISRQTVFNIFKNWDLDLSITKYFEEPIDAETLYVILDEKYISSQDKNKDSIMVKHAVIYTGKTKIGKNRHKLDNKLTVSSQKSVESFAKTINSIIDLNYTNIKNIVIAGDGAHWIESCYSDICTIDNVEKMFVLDKFHCCLAVNNISKDETCKSLLYNYMFDNKKEEFIQLLETLVELDSNRSQTVLDKANYILTHWNSIQRIKSPLFIGCPMKSHIANDLAKPFARDPKAYKGDNLQKHIVLRDYQLNNINIFNLFLKSIIKNNSETYYSTLRTKTNLPLLNSNNSNTRKNINAICHNFSELKFI